MNWEGAGQSEGIEIWRVENEHDGDRDVDFGINPWPEEEYGQFHRGDSYIVLQTLLVQEEEEEYFIWNIYFWIGSESSQDEYGVAAYKTVELDDILSDEPVQHREVEGRESPGFLSCFPEGIKYLEGGHKSGFRQVDRSEEAEDEARPDRLFRVVRQNRLTRCFEVPMACSSLNNGDAFILDTGDDVFTWFGEGVSAFERHEANSVAQNLSNSRFGHAKCYTDVNDDDEVFWSRLGGKGEIAPAADDDAPPLEISKMFIITDTGGSISVNEVELDKSNLDTSNVCLIDKGSFGIVWIGRGASAQEQQQAMVIVDRQLRILKRQKTTTVYRVKEGQEKRCPAFTQVF